MFAPTWTRGLYKETKILYADKKQHVLKDDDVDVLVFLIKLFGVSSLIEWHPLIRHSEIRLHLFASVFHCCLQCFCRVRCRQLVENKRILSCFCLFSDGSDGEEENSVKLESCLPESSDESRTNDVTSPVQENRCNTCDKTMNNDCRRKANQEEKSPCDMPPVKRPEDIPIDMDSHPNTFEDLPTYDRLKQLELKSYSMLQKLSEVVVRPSVHSRQEHSPSPRSGRLSVPASTSVHYSTNYKTVVATPKMRYMNQYRQEQANKHNKVKDISPAGSRAKERESTINRSINTTFSATENTKELRDKKHDKRFQGDTKRNLIKDRRSPHKSQDSAAAENGLTQLSSQEIPLAESNVKVEGSTQGGDITGFKCSCGEIFSSLRCFTVHMGKTGHATNHSTQLYPHKLVRGQDMWLVNGSEQTQQILKCIRCGESFKSLPDLTIHMMQTQHYTNIVSPGQMDEPVINEKFLKDTFKCKVCSESFNNLAELTDHITCHKHYKGHILKSISERAHKLRYSTLASVTDDAMVTEAMQSPGRAVISQSPRIRCEHCGLPVNTQEFSAHIRECVTIKQHNKRESDISKKLQKPSPRNPVITHSKELNVSPNPPMLSPQTCIPAHNTWRKEPSNRKKARPEDSEPMPEPLDLSRKSRQRGDTKAKPANAGCDTGDYSVLSAIQSLIDRRFKSARSNQSCSLSRTAKMQALHTDGLATTRANPAGLLGCVSQPLPSHQHARPTPGFNRHRFYQYPANYSAANAINSSTIVVNGLRSAEKSERGRDKEERHVDRAEVIKKAGNISLSSNVLRTDEKQRVLEFKSETDCQSDDGNRSEDDIKHEWRMIDRVKTKRPINVKKEQNDGRACLEIEASHRKNKSKDMSLHIKPANSIGHSNDGDDNRCDDVERSRSMYINSYVNRPIDHLAPDHYRIDAAGHFSAKVEARGRVDCAADNCNSVARCRLSSNIDRKHGSGITTAAQPKGVAEKSKQEQSLTGAELRQSDSRRDEVNLADREANEPAPAGAQRSISFDDSSVTLTPPRNNSPPESDRKNRSDEQSARQQKADYSYGQISPNGDFTRKNDPSVSDSSVVNKDNCEQEDFENALAHKSSLAKKDGGKRSRAARHDVSSDCSANKGKPTGVRGDIHHCTDAVARPSTDAEGKSSAKDEKATVCRDENLSPHKNGKDDSAERNMKATSESLRDLLDESPLNVLKRKFAPENNNCKQELQKKYTRLSAEILVDTSPVKENPLESLQKLLEKKIH